MSRRARRESLELVPMEAVPATPATEVPIVPMLMQVAAEPLCAVGLGLLRDGRHVAFEAEVVGRTVTKWTPLCAYREVHAPERTWWQVGWARVCQRRELMPAEVMANERDSRGVRQEDFEEGAAVAIMGVGRKCVALAMHLTGNVVEEPKVVTRGVREYCWAELTTWAALNMLPRRKMR